MCLSSRLIWKFIFPHKTKACIDLMHGSYTTTVVKVPHFRPPVFPTLTTGSTFKMGNLKIVVRIIPHRSGTWLHHSPVYKTFLQNNSSTYIYNKHVLLCRHGLVCATSTACFMHYIDVEIYPCQLLLICLRTIRNRTICL